MAETAARNAVIYTLSRKKLKGGCSNAPFSQSDAGSSHGYLAHVLNGPLWKPMCIKTCVMRNTHTLNAT